MYLGISGGQDSTLAGRLAQLAMEEMRAETGDDSLQIYRSSPAIWSSS